MAKPRKSSFTLPAVPPAEKWEFSVEVEKELQYLSVQLKRDIVFEKTSTVMFVIEKSLSNLKELEYPEACVEYISAQFEKAISTRKAPPRSPQLTNYLQKVKQLISEKLASAFQVPIELTEKKAEDIIDTVLKKHPLDKPREIKNAFEYWTRQALSAAPEPETPAVYIRGAPVVEIKPTSKPVEVTPTPPLVPVEVTPTPPLEEKSLEDLEAMKKTIEERMEKLKREKQTPEEPTPNQETLFVKEEILIPPSDLTLTYMEPTDYEKWIFGDFEGIIPGLEFEDLQELSDYVSLAERMTDQEKDDIRAIISKRINEIRIEGL